LNFGDAKPQVQVKLSVCLTKHQVMKTYWGGGIALRIIDLGNRRWEGQFHAPVALPPGKQPPVPIG